MLTTFNSSSDLTSKGVGIIRLSASVVFAKKAVTDFVKTIWIKREQRMFRTPIPYGSNTTTLAWRP